MNILAIDPGPSLSAWVLYDGARQSLITSGHQPNQEIMFMFDDGGFNNNTPVDELAIEDMISSNGMAVGKETLQTVKWIGRFTEMWYRTEGLEPVLVPRQTVRLHHCLSARSNDSNVRQALIDRFGSPGTKKQPGPTFGLKSHTWQAFALAVYVADTSIARSKGAA